MGRKGDKLSKYRAKKCVIDGIKFDSLKEGARYQELKLMERANAISNLELQPKFKLQDGFNHQGKRERAIHYVGDFQYIENGRVVVEDTKGFRTDVYKIKRKMFLKRYGKDIDFREI